MPTLRPDLQVLIGKFGRYECLTRFKLERIRRGFRLRFTNGIVNLGKGPLEVEGDLSKQRRVRGPEGESVKILDAKQVIYRAGKKRLIPTGKKNVGIFTYDPRPGHEHWHYDKFASYTLRSRSGKKVGQTRKQAFCLMDYHPIDRSLPHAAQAEEYTEEEGCERKRGKFRMGISVGWADIYASRLPGQFVDLPHGLKSGTYRLESKANPQFILGEVNRRNNIAAVRIRIDARRLTAVPI